MNPLEMFVWQSNRAGDPIPVVIFFGRTENPVKKARNTNGCFKLITKLNDARIQTPLKQCSSIYTKYYHNYTMGLVIVQQEIIISSKLNDGTISYRSNPAALAQLSISVRRQKLPAVVE